MRMSTATLVARSANHLSKAAFVGLKCRRNMTALAVVVGLASLSAAAKAASVTLNSSDSVSTSSFNSSGHWSNSAAPSSDNDYSVSGALILRTPTAAGSYAFGGNSLVLGDGSTSGIMYCMGTDAANTLTINNLTLNKGIIYNHTTSGVVTLAGSGIAIGGGGATFQLQSSTSGCTDAIRIQSPMSGSGAITLVRDSTSYAPLGYVSLEAANSYSGQITASATCNLRLGNQYALQYGTITWSSSGSLTFDNTIAGSSAYTIGGLSTGGGTLVLEDVNSSAVALTINRVSTTGVIAAGSVISGTGSLIKDGAGTQNLTASNTYTGGTTVLNGLLQCTADNALSSTGALTVSGGTISFGSHSNSVGLVTLVNGMINGTSTLTSTSNFAVQDGRITAKLAGNVGLNKTTSGVVYLTNTNSYTGATTVSDGVLMLSGAVASLGAPGGSTVVNAGGTLQFGSTGGGSVAIDGQALTLSGQGALDSESYYRGAMAAVSGSSASLWSWNGNVTLAGNSSILTSGTDTQLTINGAIGESGGSRALTLIGPSTGENGTLILGGVNTYSGATNIAAGTLTLGSGGSIAKSTAIDVASGAAFNVANVSGGYILGGSQTLTGDGTVSGSVTAAGTVAPGSASGAIGTLTFDANLTLTGAVTMEIAKDNGSLTSDLIATGENSLQYGGALNVNLSGSVAYAAGDTWNLFDAETLSGAFSTINLPTSAGLVWDTAQLAVDGTIRVASVPEPNTLTITAIGLWGLLVYAWRKRK